MKRKRTMKRQWLAAMVVAAAFSFGAGQQAMAQTPVQQGIRTGSNTATVNGTNITTNGQVVSAGRGTTVTVTTTDRTGESTPKVAKVTVTKKEDFLAESITVTSAGGATLMNCNATLQMTANIIPTYTDNKTVTWSVASAPESSATATIDENGLLTAGTTPGAVIVTATTQDGSNLQATKTITITTNQLMAVMITVAAVSYTGSALTPTVTVNDGARNLIQGTDFTLGSWTNNVNAGTASVTVTGMGAYTGSVVKNFTIDKARATYTKSYTHGSGQVFNMTITVNNYAGTISWSNYDSSLATPNGSSCMIVTNESGSERNATASWTGDANHQAGKFDFTLKRTTVTDVYTDL